jgi:hypothetical protein
VNVAVPSWSFPEASREQPRSYPQDGETREQLDADGLAYLREHRPDFYEYLTGEVPVG